MSEEISESDLRAKYQDRAKAMTPEGLQAFIDDVMAEPLGYGSTCIAIGMIAGAAAWAMERGPKGGVTGFMASAISWEFLRTWGSLCPGEAGGRMMDFNDMLFPQYNRRYTTIPESTFEKLQEIAAKKLEGREGVPAVRAHWQSIVDGQVPFGFGLSAD